MKKRNGFTLIELIATITIFGIIMLVVSPNIVAISDKNERTAYIIDAKNLVKLAKYEFYSTVDNRNITTYYLNNLDQTNFLDSPNSGKEKNGEYLPYCSYVSVSYNSSRQTYQFSVRLIEIYAVNGNRYFRGVYTADSQKLNEETAKNSYVKNYTCTNYTSSSCYCY